MSRSFQYGALPIDAASSFGPAIVEMTIGLPREADAAMRLDVLLRRQMKCFGRGDTRGGGGQRQFGRIGGQRPRTVIGIRARQLDRDIDVGELVLDRLERADGAAERVALQCVVARHGQAGIGAADLLERDHDRGAIEQALYRRPARRA